MFRLDDLHNLASLPLEIRALGRPCSIIERTRRPETRTLASVMGHAPACGPGRSHPIRHRLHFDWIDGVRGAANVSNATDRMHILLLKDAHRGGEAPVRTSFYLIRLAPGRTIPRGPACSAIAHVLLLDKR